MYSLSTEFSVYQYDIHCPLGGEGREVDRKCLKSLLTLMFTSSLEAKGKGVHFQK